MLPADHHPLVVKWFNWYCRFALRKFFHRVHLFGDVPFDPKIATLYVVNHSSFWDPIAMNFLIQTFRPQTAYCMSDAVQMRKQPFFRLVGAFSVDRTNPRDGFRAIRYAADLLNASPCAVVIFPQGKSEPADKIPLTFERGIARIIEQSPNATVISAAIRYEFWIDQRAELLIDLAVANDRSVGAMEAQMAGQLEKLKQAGRGFREGNRILLTGRRSISEWTARGAR